MSAGNLVITDMSSSTLISNKSSIYQLVKKVTEVTVGLSQIAKDEGLDLHELAEVWAALPIEENEGMTYLEAASQCILDVSALVDRIYPARPSSKRTALKFRVMSKLLALKAEQLDQDF